jgi:hypothetical protein
MEFEDEKEFEFNEEFEAILAAAESNGSPGPLPQSTAAQIKSTQQESMDIEDAPVLSPFERFRRHGYLSVSDLVGTVWCEVQVGRNPA